MKNELRIGNLLFGSIYFDEEEARNDLGDEYTESEEWKITKVEGIPHEFENHTAWTDQEFNRLKPIPVTEEWLKNFGFYKRDLYGYDRWVYNDFEIENHGKYLAKVIWSESCPATTHYIGHFQYVHSLQNLFFALTKKELTLKEEVKP